MRTITEEGLNNSSAKLLPPNTILLSSRATIGECSLSLRECATNQWFSISCIQKMLCRFSLLSDTNKEKGFNQEILWVNLFRDFRKLKSVKIQVSVPTDVEQQKIAGLLSLIDERIATQNKIIEKLQSLIKGLSQQLLSSENDWILYRLVTWRK